MTLTPPPLKLVRPGALRAASQPDGLLMALVQQDDRTAFTTLMGRWQERVQRFCRRVVRDNELAHELTQDTFVAIWKARASYRRDGNFQAWVFRIAANRCHSANRKRKLRRFVLLRDDDLTTFRTPASDLEREQHRFLVSRALDALPTKFRVPLLLRYVEGMDYAVIAEVIGRTPSTARSRVHYGLKQLARTLPQEVRP